MRLFGFFSVGILFGIVLSKSEAISWFRIHEMFRFESFHMYGIIGTAVVLGIIIISLMKRSGIKTLRGNTVSYKTKPLHIFRFIAAGSIFGLGWALMGACPGPMFIMLGHGFGIFLISLLAATLGALVYGMVRHRLPR